MPVDVEAKVKGILAEQLMLGADVITLSDKLGDDLDADSIDAVEIVMQLEEAFDIEIPDDDIYRFKTVKDVIDYITEKTK